MAIGRDRRRSFGGAGEDDLSVTVFVPTAPFYGSNFQNFDSVNTQMTWLFGIFVYAEQANQVATSRRWTIKGSRSMPTAPTALAGLDVPYSNLDVDQRGVVYRPLALNTGRRGRIV